MARKPTLKASHASNEKGAPASTIEQKNHALAFRVGLIAALEHFTDAAWLGQNSPLASAYFLNLAAIDSSDMVSENYGQARGELLQQTLLAAAKQLPPREAAGSYDPQQLLKLTYFQPDIAHTQEGYAMKLNIGIATYYRHRDRAIEQLENILLRQKHTPLRLEMPRMRELHEIVGHETVLAHCQQAIAQRQLLAITGSSGMGKTTLASNVAHIWAAAMADISAPTAQPQDFNSVFWFTFRRSINDYPSHFLFALAYFLHQHGKSTLWSHLLADPHKFDLGITLAIMRQCLTELAGKILICLDETDLLCISDVESREITQLRGVVETLIQAAQGHFAVILVGHRLLVEPQVHVSLNGLTLQHTKQLFHQALQHAVATPLSDNDIERIHDLTQGNPLMLRLLIVMHLGGRSLAQLSHDLPKNMSFRYALDRMQRYLPPLAQRILHMLAVFDTPAPLDAWQNADEQASLQFLIQRNVVSQHNHSIALPPALRESLLNSLAAEEREKWHLFAAKIFAARGEYTNAARHYVAGNQLALGIWVWYLNREGEIRMGQSPTAYALFRNISREQLSNDHDRQALVLLRAELYRAWGESEQALEDLQSLRWRDHDPNAPDHLALRGDVLDDTSQLDAALDTFRASQNTAHRMLELQLVNAHVRTGNFYKRRLSDMGKAMREAQLARFEAEQFQGDVYDVRGELDLARQHLSQALAIAQALNDPLRIARTHSLLGTVNSRAQAYDIATTHYQQAIIGYKKVGEIARAERVRGNMGANYIVAKQYEAALEACIQALAFFENIGQSYWVATTAQNAAEACYYLGRYDIAEQYLNQAMQQEEQSFIAYIFTVLGMIRRAQGRDEASISALQQAIAAAHENEDRWAEAAAWRELAHSQKQSGNSQAQCEALTHALRLFTSLQLLDEIKQIEQALSVIICS